VPFWLVASSYSTRGLIHRLYFVVVLPNGNVVEPRVEKRLKRHFCSGPTESIIIRLGLDPFF
jgi:hypothetical protein